MIAVSPEERVHCLEAGCSEWTGSGGWLFPHSAQVIVEAIVKNEDHDARDRGAGNRRRTT